MAEQRKSRDVLCPFYKGADNRAVFCEPPFEADSFRTRFRGKADLDRHMKQFCMDRYQYCEICIMLTWAYDDE